MVAHLALRLLELFEFFLVVTPHFGVGLGGKPLLGFLDLVVEFEIAAIGKRDLRQRTALLGQGRQARAIGGDRGIDQRGFEFQEPLIIGL